MKAFFVVLSPMLHCTSHQCTSLYSLIDVYSIFRYENPEISLHTGMILREFIRYESLAKCLLRDERFYSLFGYVEMSTFDIASDAFTTFKVM